MKKSTFILFGIMLLKIVMQFIIISPAYDLHRDEYLYLAEANHLAFGFIEVPPVTALFALLIKVFGNSVFLVKLVPALFGALMIAFTWKIVEEIGGNVYAQVLASVTLLFSAFLRINMLFQPNSFDCLCWTILFFIFIKWINTQRTKYLYYFALFVAISFLNKYSILFLMATFFLAVILSPYRTLFASKHFYFAMLLALLLISPNIYWQIQHGVPFFHHMLALSKEQLENMSRMDFLNDQLLFFIGSVAVVVTGFLSVFLSYNKKYVVLFLTVFFTFALFIYFKAKGYYAIGLYPVIIAFGSEAIERFLAKWNSIAVSLVRVVLIVMPVLLFIPFFNVAFPVLSPQQVAKNNKRFEKLGLLRWEDGKNHVLPQDFADMLGWKELAVKTQNIWNEIPAEEQKNTIIITDNYGQAGAINFYTNGKLNAHSSEASFALWLLEDMHPHTIIVVGDAPGTSATRYFSLHQKVDSISNSYAREYGTGIYILRGANALFYKDFWLPYIKESREYYRYFK